jgi:hypothetical protein
MGFFSFVVHWEDMLAELFIGETTRCFLLLTICLISLSHYGVCRRALVMA